MQLGNSSQTQQPDSASQQLLNTLLDIASNVQIHSNFCISHPNYKPLELPDEVVARFQRMPADIQNKYFRLQLRSFLYGIYYNGSMRATLTPDADSADLALHQDLENNTRLGVDIAFYERLHSCNRGSGYFDPGWSVVRLESDGTFAVSKGGLTLHIEPNKHLHKAEQKVPFAFEVLHNPLNYRLYNSGFLKFPFNPDESYRYKEILLPVLQAIYAENKSHFREQVPIFTKVLAPGIGLAEHPTSKLKFELQQQFGENRCEIVANAMLEAHQNGDESKQARMKYIIQHFERLGLDIERPYLNPNSEDIYTPLD